MYPERKHPLDVAAFIVACIALVGAIASAWYAQRQVAVAKDTEERQLRAYVEVTSVSFAINDNIAEARLAPKASASNPPAFTHSTFVLHLKNFGTTPAHIISVNWQPATFTGSGEIDPNFTFNDKAESVQMGIPTRPILNPGETLDTPINLTQRNLGILRIREAGKEGLLVFGNVTYEDTFRNRWQNKYCYLVLGSASASPRFAACDKHNEETLISP
ncbi:hypothetical protein [Paraburkholderia tropica]|uniref:hypothetical protein n=1 Tax=Paraburkholderia tropica TaxID=92647 RepID=UPI002AB0F9F2|nr:hypothetical protein [Paraburkholderia tropica]